MTNPFTVNIFDRTEPNAIVMTFPNAAAAIAAAEEECRYENTVHVTVTDEDTGEDIFDEPGEYHNLISAKE